MMGEVADTEFVLKFAGPIVDAQNGAPVTIVAAALSAMQRLAHLIGMQLEGRELLHRARVPASVQARYAVLCGIPSPGSLLEPVKIAPLVHDLVAMQAAEHAGIRLTQFFGAVGEQDATAVAAVAPDSGYRRLMLAELFNMAPLPDSGVDLTILDTTGALRFSATRSRGYVEGLLRPKKSLDQDGILTGRLNEIDFAGRRLVLLEASTHRKLSCLYNEVVEPMLLENGREMIQVHGTIVRDADGRPESIQDVREVHPLDTSPFQVERFNSGSEEIRVHPSLYLQVDFDAATGMLTAGDAELSIDAWGETRDQLEASVRTELDTLWRLYAIASPDTLAEDAIELQSRLCARFSLI